MSDQVPFDANIWDGFELEDEPTPALLLTVEAQHDDDENDEMSDHDADDIVLDPNGLTDQQVIDMASQFSEDDVLHNGGDDAGEQLEGLDEDDRSVSDDDVLDKVNSTAPPKVRVRNNFSIVQKLKTIIAVEQGMSKRQAAKEFLGNVRLVRRLKGKNSWMPRKDEYILLLHERMSHGKSWKDVCRLSGAGRKAKHIQEEKTIYEWYLKFKVGEQNYCPQSRILHEANALFPTIEMTEKWLNGFMRRHSLVQKSIKRKPTMTQEQMHSKFREMLNYARRESRKGIKVHPKMGKFLPKNTWNSDQIPVAFHNEGHHDICPENTDSDVRNVDKNAHKRFGTWMSFLFYRDNNDQPMNLLLF